MLLVVFPPLLTLRNKVQGAPFGAKNHCIMKHYSHRFRFWAREPLKRHVSRLLDGFGAASRFSATLDPPKQGPGSSVWGKNHCVMKHFSHRFRFWPREPLKRHSSWLLGGFPALGSFLPILTYPHEARNVRFCGPRKPYVT